MRYTAPYRGFRYKILSFNLGFIETSNENTIEWIKQIQISLGEIKDINGEIINKPKKKRKAPDVIKNKPR